MYELSAVDADPWWLSATAPWWATPVATLAGAVLAWVLARLTLNRTEQREDRADLRQRKIDAYAEFWAAGLDYTRSESHNDPAGASEAILRASNVMLPIELFGSAEVLKSAQAVMWRMSGEDSSDERIAAMSAFREQVKKDVRS